MAQPPINTNQAPGDAEMSSPGLRSLLQSLRGALSGDAQGSRLQLSITGPQAPVTAPGPAAALEGGHGGATTIAEEQQRLLSHGGGGGSGTLLPAVSDPTLPGLLDAAGSGPQAGGAGGDATAGDAGNAGSEVSGVAAAAEHHRLTNLSSSIDLRAVALALERGLPYAILLLFLFISMHIVGISVYAYLSFVLFRINTLIRSQVALKQDRQARSLLVAAGVAAAQVPLVLLLLRGQDLAGNLVLEGRRRPSKFWDVVFAVVAGDTLLRYLSVLAKVAALLAMPVDSPPRFRRRGHVLTAIENCFAVYRQLPPAPLWYHFFTQVAVGGMLQTGLSGAYLLVKAQHFFERLALAALAVRQVAVRGYGSVPSPEEIQEAGNSCPICQDAYHSPVKLSCGHIFCTDCCGEWFERERTCPMCRAAVGPSNQKFKSAGDGRTSLLPIIF